MVALSGICFQWSREEETDGRLVYFRLSDLCGVVVYTDRVLLMVNRWSTSPKTRKELHLTFRGPFEDCATRLKVTSFHGSLVGRITNSQKSSMTHSLSKIGSESTIQLTHSTCWFVHLLMLCRC